MDDVKGRYDDKLFLVYVVKNVLTGKKYVGRTSIRKDTPKPRINKILKETVCAMVRRSKGDLFNEEDSKKDSWDIMDVELEANLFKANERKKELIKEYNTKQPLGYNII